MKNLIAAARLFFGLSLLFYSCQKEELATIPNGLTAPDQATSLKVNVKLLVGEFLYENIETSVLVRGFDANNNESWSKSFPYSGPTDNIISVRSGFDHYIISMEKWGVSDSQTITSVQLSNNRADGPAPVTYSLGGKLPFIKKPVYSIDYLQYSESSFPVQTKTEYKYNSVGKIERMILYDYTSEKYILNRYFVFTYNDGASLSRSIQYAADDSKIAEDVYEYGVDGYLLKISETNFLNGINGSMSLSFDDTYSQAKAVYSFSNGTGFEYSFLYNLKNIISDKTINAGSLCNQGSYTLDKNINPFKHLGYISFFLDNYSVNNKLVENVDYTSCSFPSLIPESYSYQYDSLGYPTMKVTQYKGKSQVAATKYYYQYFPQ